MVAPLVGAWIEISTRDCKCAGEFQSLPSWERGLKYIKEATNVIENPSLPSWERGLKYSIIYYELNESGRSPRGSVD